PLARPGANPRVRARGILIGLLVVLSLFAAQLVRVQGLDAGAAAALAMQTRVYTETTPALRGTIYDATGTILASSIEKRIVIADPKAVVEYKKKVDGKTTKVGAAGAAADLAPLLKMSEADVLTEITRPKTRYVEVNKNVSPLTWHTIAELGIPGIYSKRTSVRTYPQGSTAASLVGFTGENQEGAGGIETYLNSSLRGVPGELKYEVGQDGIRLPMGASTESPAKTGRSVQLTIRNDLQWYAQNVLAQKMIDVRASSGTVVVTNAKTGDLLAIASYPTFDPNTKIADNAQLTNLAFTEVFEPGSTAKVITAAAALEEGKVTPSTPMIVPYSLRRSDGQISDSHSHPTEYLTFAGALAQSSNTGIVLAGEQIPPATMESYFRKFGFGSKSAVNFPGESAGLLAPAGQWSGTQRYTVMYGQGLSVTALQAAGVYQTIANGGVHIAPKLVTAMADANGKLQPTPESAKTRVISQDSARQLSQMLEGVVGADGTAPAAQIPGYRVAGKTGTALRYDSRVKGYAGYTASFIGYAPAGDPELVVSVIVQNPKKEYYGGSVAAPVFHDVMLYALTSLDIPPTPGDTEPPKLTLKLDETPDPDDPAVLRDRR
ncbi:peptidoglycan D,D-transpeptidase FtsI family protein, partial [Nostocoides australiense]|uniref:peptidoglycan D,D-transpeptidase FtsI family protein n=1 Tax=Nostocoides australiense TaxID=99480 RepID=UPI002E14E783